MFKIRIFLGECGGQSIAIWDNSHNAAFIAIKAWSISSVEL